MKQNIQSDNLDSAKTLPSDGYFENWSNNHPIFLKEAFASIN